MAASNYTPLLHSTSPSFYNLHYQTFSSEQNDTAACSSAEQIESLQKEIHSSTFPLKSAIHASIQLIDAQDHKNAQLCLKTGVLAYLEQVRQSQPTPFSTLFGYSRATNPNDQPNIQEDLRQISELLLKIGCHAFCRDAREPRESVVELFTAFIEELRDNGQAKAAELFFIAFSNLSKSFGCDAHLVELSKAHPLFFSSGIDAYMTHHRIHETEAFAEQTLREENGSLRWMDETCLERETVRLHVDEAILRRWFQDWTLLVGTSHERYTCLESADKRKLGTPDEMLTLHKKAAHFLAKFPHIKPSDLRLAEVFFQRTYRSENTCFISGNLEVDYNSYMRLKIEKISTIFQTLGKAFYLAS